MTEKTKKPIYTVSLSTDDKVVPLDIQITLDNVTFNEVRAMLDRVEHWVNDAQAAKDAENG